MRECSIHLNPISIYEAIKDYQAGNKQGIQVAR